MITSGLTNSIKQIAADAVCPSGSTIKIALLKIGASGNYDKTYTNPYSVGMGGDECDLTFNFNASPTNGAGTWTMTSGSGTATYVPNANDPNAQVIVSAYGTKQFTWTEVNGVCSDNDVITVNFYQQPTIQDDP